MKNRITEVLKECGIEVYRINITEEETAEFFFVKRNLDMKRKKRTMKAEVTVYRDFEKDGRKCRGNALCTIEPSNTKEEIAQKLESAYQTCAFVPNAYYEIAPALQEKQGVVRVDSKLAEEPLSESAYKLITAFYGKDLEKPNTEKQDTEGQDAKKQDTEESAFVNSAEFFLSRKNGQISNSNGVEATYVKYGIDGEFVVQCREPQDVETHQTFQYDDLSCDELVRKVKQIIVRTKDRALAKEAVPSGSYPVILSDESVPVVLGYYTERAMASYIYQQYSDFKVGESIQGDLSQVTGERLNLTYLPTVPFSQEGLLMKELPLAENGILKNIQADCRFASYLQVPATGIYPKLRCAAGTVSFEDMKKQRSLYVVNFSDFQMDSLEGNFAGEIRLAYYFDGEKTIPVTGGSINGNIFEAQKHFVFSKELQKDSGFEGPYAILLKDVNVAGSESRTEEN